MSNQINFNFMTPEESKEKLIENMPAVVENLVNIEISVLESQIDILNQKVKDLEIEKNSLQKELDAQIETVSETESSLDSWYAIAEYLDLSDDIDINSEEIQSLYKIEPFGKVTNVEIKGVIDEIKNLVEHQVNFKELKNHLRFVFGAVQYSRENIKNKPWYIE